MEISKTHVSVLLQESIHGLDIKEGDVFLDATLGGAGHSAEIAPMLGATGTLIGLDADAQAIKRAVARLASAKCKVFLEKSNFRNIDTALSKVGIEKIDKALFDLGLSSQEIDESGRGFTFKKDEPLLMTFADSIDESTLTAREIVNTWDEENIATIIKNYGEERYAYRIAKKIVASRKNKPIETTFDLVEIVKQATPSSYHRMKLHPATRTFQALRMTVNDEVGALTDGLTKTFSSLSSGGRVAVISFHSIEDRIVKQFFKKLETDGIAKRITKKPIVPSDLEREQNPRSRSAKLRVISKL